MSTISTHFQHTFKKDLAFLYNRVNQEIYGVGVKKQRIETFDDRVSATYSNGTEILVLNSVHAAIIEQAEEKAMDHGFEQGYQDAMVNAVPSLERYHRSRTRKISKAV